MLTSLVLQLKSSRKAALPATLGRAGQALLLELVGKQDTAVAQAMHRGDGPKPYTASNLVMGKRRKDMLRLEAGEDGWLRFTGLTAEVSGQLQALALEPPETVMLADHCFEVSGATLDAAEHPWAGQVDYQNLAAPFLLGSRRKMWPKVNLEFASPTTFKSKGRAVPLPLPELVFGSLLNRWQEFAPIGLHPDTRRFAEETVVLSRYKLRTRGVPVKQGGMRIGFTGRVTFTALNKDRYWLNVLHLLAAFAFYGGVGSQTTMGLGQVREF